MRNAIESHAQRQTGASGQWSFALVVLRVGRFVPYVVLLAACFSVFTVTTDDPFITYRYAANVLAGHGPVFNVGERVEGFSSPLHLLLCALLLKIAPQMDILFKVKLLGVYFAAVAIYQTGGLARRTGLTAWQTLFAQSLVALNINFALAAVNGLETTLFTCLLAAVLEAFLRECRGRGGIVSAWLLGAALLARPETVLLFVGLLAVRAGLAWRQKRGRGLLLWASAFIWIVGLLTLSRMAYYNHPLPNTYYAKHVTLVRGLNDGAWYLLRTLSPTVVDVRSLGRMHTFGRERLAAFGTLVFWLLALLGLWRCRRQKFGWALGAVIAALVLFVLRYGGDWMAGWRFLVPALPVFAVVQCHGLRALLCLFRGKSPEGGRARLVVALPALAVWAGCALVAPHSPWSEAHYSTHSDALLRASGALGRKWVVTADFIRRNAAPGATVAYSEMGYAGWENPDKTFIDVRGLTDTEIARLPDGLKGTFGLDDERWFVPGDPLYRILDRRDPDMIVAFSHQNAPTIVLGRYFLSALVSDPRDPESVIVPSLVYISAKSADPETK